MHAFYHILASVKANVIAIKQQGLGALEMEIKIIESQIQALEGNDSNNSLLDSTEYRSLCNRYTALLRQNHSRWRLRTKMNWIIDGDMNSFFFHKSVIIHRDHDFIANVMDYVVTSF